MKSQHILSLVILGMLAVSPAFAQFPTPHGVPLPDPDPGEDPPICDGFMIACPQKAPDRTIHPGRRRQGPESATQGLSLASPMPFWAVGHGNGDHSSSLYQFGLWGNITNFVDYGELGTVIWDIAILDNFGPLYLIGENKILYKYFPDTGTLTTVGNTGYQLSSLEQCGGQLYGWGVGILVRINPNTAQATVVGYPSATSSGDLMCTFSGTLYGIARGVGTGNDTIVVFNTTYGYSSYIGITLPGREFFAGEIDGEGRMFVGRQNGSNIELRYVDLATGTISLVGTYPTTIGMYGLATAPVAW